MKLSKLTKCLRITLFLGKFVKKYLFPIDNFVAMIHYNKICIDKNSKTNQLARTHLGNYKISSAGIGLHWQMA